MSGIAVDKFKQFRSEQLSLKFLENLNQAERDILKAALVGKSQTVNCDRINKSAVALVQKGLLVKTPEVPSTFQHAYIVPHFVWRKINSPNIAQLINPGPLIANK